MPFWNMFRRHSEAEDDGASSTEPLQDALQRAQFLLVRATEAGRTIPPGAQEAIDRALEASRSGPLTGDVRKQFLTAYGTLRNLTSDLSKRRHKRAEYPFEEALEDSELLLKHASEAGTELSLPVSAAIIAARSALKSNTVTDEIRGAFYASYGLLSKELNPVTAQTIRSCNAADRGGRLRWDRAIAGALTVLVAFFSIIVFIGDSRSKKITEVLDSENKLATQIRGNMAPTEGDAFVPALKYAQDPCKYLEDAPGADEPVITKPEEVEQLQQFAANMRDVRSRAIKLNDMQWWIPFFGVFECDPYLGAQIGTCPVTTTTPELQRKFELNPALRNFVAEATCKIEAYQKVRDFANNVNSNYVTFVGATSSIALPILYALLGAYAFRLRQFGDTIRKQTYHPSYADSARLITAVIAGAVFGMFNPGQSISLQPFAIAFLVGYGVEVFFKVLDNFVAAFGSIGPGRADTRPARPVG